MAPVVTPSENPVLMREDDVLAYPSIDRTHNLAEDLLGLHPGVLTAARRAAPSPPPCTPGIQGEVQCVRFHGSKPFLFVATKQQVRIYHLIKQVGFDVSMVMIFAG